VSKDKPNLPEPEPNDQKDQPAPSPGPSSAAGNEIDEFFHRLPGNFRWPKPSPEAVAAAVEAIHRLSGDSPAQDLGAEAAKGSACSACGGALPAGARFCVWCGIRNEQVAGEGWAASASGAAQHHVHHHFHHFVPGGAAAAETAPAASSVPRGRAPGAPGSLGGRAEAGARQVVLDWAQACNTRHIDDLVELYAADATLIRSNVPPVRSLPAIREFLASLLEAGLGDVEMDSLRVEVMGEIALDLGRAKMLVPVAMGKRREERGKYLVVLVRQPAGTWKILADFWTADLTLSAPAPSEGVARENDTAPPLRKPR
jgi:ketosteroid isomerase-like protein